MTEAESFDLRFMAMIEDPAERAATGCRLFGRRWLLVWVAYLAMLN